MTTAASRSGGWQATTYLRVLVFLHFTSVVRDGKRACYIGMYLGMYVVFSWRKVGMLDVMARGEGGDREREREEKHTDGPSHSSGPIDKA